MTVNKNFNLTGCQYCNKFHWYIEPSVKLSKTLGKDPYLGIYDITVSCDNGAFKNVEMVFDSETKGFPTVDEVIDILMSSGRIPKDCPERHCYVGKDSRDRVLLDKLNNILRSYDIPEDKIFGISTAFGEELSKFK